LLLWGFIAAVGLAATALLCSVSADVADSAVAGTPGTQVVVITVLVITLAGVVVEWRPVPRRAHQGLVVLLGISAAATTVLAVDFFAGGEYAGVGILLIQSALFIAVIAARLARPHGTTESRRSRRHDQ
jgi:hypothetical protein